MSLKDRLMRRIGAEREMGCWHFPRFTEGCWGKRTEKLCWCCKVRYPVKLIKLMWRYRKT